MRDHFAQGLHGASKCDAELHGNEEGLGVEGGVQKVDLQKIGYILGEQHGQLKPGEVWDEHRCALHIRFVALAPLERVVFGGNCPCPRSKAPPHLLDDLEEAESEHNRQTERHPELSYARERCCHD